MVFVGSFWFGWCLLNQAHKHRQRFDDFLEGMSRSHTRAKKLSASEIAETVLRASRYFWFHKRQPCMASGLAAFYYLNAYGYEPYFIMQLGIREDIYYNCHCHVCLTQELAEKHFQKTILYQKKHLIYVKKETKQTEGENGQYHNDGLLQPELPLLFCEDHDDPRSSKSGKI